MERRIMFLALAVVMMAVLCLSVWAGDVFYLDGADVVRGADPAVSPEGMVPLTADSGRIPRDRSFPPPKPNQRTEPLSSLCTS